MEKDKELDNLFKRGFDDPGHQPDFRDDDWEAMESMLDGNKKRAGIVYWLPILGAVAAMLLIAFGLWMFMHKTPENQQTVKNRISPKDTSNTKQRNPGISDGSIQRNEKIYASTQSKVESAVHTAGRDTISPATVANNTSYSHKGQPTVIPSAGGGRRDTTGPVSEQPFSVAQPGGREILASISSTPTFSSQSRKIDTIEPKDVQAKQNYGDLAFNREKANAAASRGYKPQFAITVLGSSDLNGLNSFSQSKVGTNFGALFSAGIFNRLTVSIGAVYSSKPYLTNFDNYRGSFKFPNTPATVSADCRMIDVPLNLDYSLYNKHRNKFSVGTGLSSYLMFHENYNYSYGAYGNGPASYSVPSPGKYYLSILNLQATYQRQINSRLGLDVQPYVKLPLSGVGLYDSKLQSTGVAVGLTWSLGNH